MRMTPDRRGSGQRLAEDRHSGERDEHEGEADERIGAAQLELRDRGDPGRRPASRKRREERP